MCNLVTWSVKHVAWITSSMVAQQSGSMLRSWPAASRASSLAALVTFRPLLLFIARLCWRQLLYNRWEPA